jgi:hypothetical protein
MLKVWTKWREVCPSSGKNIAIGLYYLQTQLKMSDLNEFRDLVAYLARTSRLSPQEASHLVAEVLTFLEETPAAFVQRRHRALQAQGCSNDEIFTRLESELARWRFRAPGYTARQIRRMVYG